MIYDVEDRVPSGKKVMFAIQMLLSVFTATALIATICGVNMGAALVGAGLSTLVYSFITKGKSPMFMSNSGAFVAPVIFALGAAGYTGVAIGGLTTFIVYAIFGFIFTKIPSEKIFKFMPPALIGAVTMVIGINLMGFIPTYVQINGETNQWGVCIALFTALVTALISHYAKGILKILPFLLGILAGYTVAVICTITGLCNIVDLSLFKSMTLFSMPTFAFTQWGAITWANIVAIVVIYIAYTLSAACELLSDHAALGGIIGRDLYKDPGLHRLFFGEGAANIVGSSVGGLGICSYGEGVACVGFSKVAAVSVTRLAAIFLALLGFIGPVQTFIASIPGCVFAGSAIILYGFIAASGVKMLQRVDLNQQKPLIIVSSVLSLGVSGLVLGGDTISLTTTALALVMGIILNLVLKEKKENGNIEN